MVDPAESESALDSRARRLTWLRTSSLSVLLVVLVVGVFVIPFLAPSGGVWRNDDLLLPLILVSGIVAVAEHRRIVVLLIMWSVVVTVVRWSGRALPIDTSPTLRDASALGALLLLATAVSINVFRLRHALRDRIFGAVVLYLLLGVIWAMAYAMADRLVPQAFAGRLETGTSLGNWTYFSFVTLTTLGYGDITPVAHIVRSLATLEALIGQLYPAIIIARLVSLQGSNR